MDPEAKLKKIEKIARDAFSDPDTLDINLHRAQALANILMLFEYEEPTEQPQTDDDQMTFDDLLGGEN